MRKTKIIVTIGPSSCDPDTLERLIIDGMDCARLNFSHGTHAEHAEVIESIRRLSNKHNRPVAVLQDLGGQRGRIRNRCGCLGAGSERCLVGMVANCPHRSSGVPASRSPALLPGSQGHGEKDGARCHRQEDDADGTDVGNG